MSYRNVFDEAISDESVPPSSVDVGAIVGRERRRRRWLTVGGSAGAASVAAVAASLFVMFGTGGPGTLGIDVGGPGSPGNNPSAGSAQPSQVAPSGRSVTVTTPSVPAAKFNAEQSARLSAVLEAKVRSLLPAGTTYLDSRVNGVASGPFQIVPYPPDDLPAGAYANSFVGGPSIRDGSGTGALNVLIGKAVQQRNPERGVTVGDPIGQFKSCIPELVSAGCQVRSGPNGESLVVTPRFHDEGGSKIARIDVSKPDGTGIVLYAQNWGESTDGGQISPAQRPNLPLTVDQLIEIALDPDMTIIV